MSKVIWLDDCIDLGGVPWRSSVDAHAALAALNDQAPEIMDAFISSRDVIKQARHSKELELRVDKLDAEPFTVPFTVPTWNEWYGS